MLGFKKAARSGSDKLVTSLRNSSIANGSKVLPPGPGTIPGPRWATDITACLNALLTVTIKMTDSVTGEAKIGDNGTLLLIPRGSTGGGTSATGMVYRGLYSSLTDYAVNDVVYTQPDADTRIVWVCEIENGPSTSVHAPTWAEPATVYWRCLAHFVVGGTAYQMKVSTNNTDYLVCKKWDGSTESEESYNVAKPPEFRSGATVIDDYAAGDVIYAIASDHTGVSVGGTELTLVDMNACGRAVGLEFHYKDANDGCKEYKTYLHMSTPELVT